jgi:ubiquinone/menaquinone biosynthesis C-methylase UbiE
MSRAIESELLEQRIAENAAAQEIDLATWIFERINVSPGDRVLELCCGTGGQTLSLLERVGNDGKVVALDVSKSALNTLAGNAASYGDRLTLVEGNLENVPASLHDALPAQIDFDWMFCAYGLYYSSDAPRTLREARSLLKRDGRIVVAGPFGPNNKPLFDLVRESGVNIAEPVVFSSELFMLQMVLPWAARNFESVAVSTMVNPVRWNSAERVMNYWQNTTFYDAGRKDDFKRRVDEHFAKHRVFVNEKWVMLVEMSHGRD